MSLLDLSKSVRRKKNVVGVSFISLIDNFLFKQELDLLRGKIKGIDIVKEEARIHYSLAKLTYVKSKNLDPNYRDDFLHPSSLGSCARKTFYSRFHAPKNTMLRGFAAEVAKSQRIFANGAGMHLRMDILFVRMGLCSIDDIEVPFTDGDLQGTCDAIVEVNGVKYIVDFKSSNSYIFKTLGTKNKSQYLDSYDTQMNLYMDKFGAKHGVFIYENKDNQALHETFVEYDAAAKTKTEERLAYIRKHIDERTEPDREGDCVSTYPCKGCKYTAVCYGEDKSWIKNLQTGKKKLKRVSPKK